MDSVWTTQLCLIVEQDCIYTEFQEQRVVRQNDS